MRTKQFLIAALIFACAAGCHSRTASQAISSTDREKGEAQARQANIDVRTYQINHSNLPPAEKQRLLEQVHASGGK